MSSYWYPLPFLEQAVNNGQTFAQLTGLAGLLQSGCPAPSFPIKKEYIDVTQIMSYTVLGIEKRYTSVGRLPRRWVLTYDAITDSELAYLESFYVNMRGKWDYFKFVDPEKWVFGDPSTFVVSDINNSASVRFDNIFSAQRYSKNYYSLELVLFEVFEPV